MMAETIIGLASSTACAKLADVLREEIEYGRDAWDRLREWLAYLDPGEVVDRTGTDMPARAWRLTGLLAWTPYSDLPALVAALEAKAAA